MNQYIYLRTYYRDWYRVIFGKRQRPVTRTRITERVCVKLDESGTAFVLDWCRQYVNSIRKAINETGRDEVQKQHSYFLAKKECEALLDKCKRELENSMVSNGTDHAPLHGLDSFEESLEIRMRDTNWLISHIAILVSDSSGILM